MDAFLLLCSRHSEKIRGARCFFRRNAGFFLFPTNFQPPLGRKHYLARPFG